MDSVDLNTIFDDIKKILVSNGWDKPLPMQLLENRYKNSCQRELTTDCARFGLSVDDFIVRSEIFRLYLRSGKTHVYLAPEKMEQPLPAPTVVTQPPKRFKRKKKRQSDVTVFKFRATSWGSFEPIKSEQTTVAQELMPRPPAFDMYSDNEDDDDCDVVEVPEPKKEPPPAPVTRDTFNQQGPSGFIPPPLQTFSTPPIQPPSTYNQTTYISSQQIDGPIMFDFQEEERGPVEQDLSLYAMRQNEYNRFHYNDLPIYRRNINFRAQNNNFREQNNNFRAHNKNYFR